MTDHIPPGTKPMLTSDQRVQTLEKLLREAVKIVHCHARNTDKEWLLRARAALREGKK